MVYGLQQDSADSLREKTIAPHTDIFVVCRTVVEVHSRGLANRFLQILFRQLFRISLRATVKIYDIRQATLRHRLKGRRAHPMADALDKIFVFIL